MVVIIGGSIDCSVIVYDSSKAKVSSYAFSDNWFSCVLVLVVITQDILAKTIVTIYHINTSTKCWVNMYFCINNPILSKVYLAIWSVFLPSYLIQSSHPRE